MKLNTQEWLPFKFEKVFDVEKGFYNKKPEHGDEKEDIPFLGATDKNNGVTEFYSLSEIKSSSKMGKGKNEPLSQKIFPGNALCVTNNGKPGNAYYQEGQFTCSHDVNPLYIKNGKFNFYTAMFIATLIKHDRYRWKYGRKWRPERMKSSIINLPVDSNKKPDWKYMEDYIKTLHYLPITTKNVDPQYSLNVNLWEEFKLSDIMDIFNGQGITKEEIQENPGGFPAVQSGETNNGIIGFISKEYCKKKNYTMTEEACLTVARTGTAGFVALQKDGCVVGDSAKILQLKEQIPNNISIYIFIATLLNKNRFKYAYGRKVVEDKYMNTIIKLPVNENGDPDWKKISEFIKELPYGDRLLS